jgi:nicotinate-nucleotide adenylyltransferase
MKTGILGGTFDPVHRGHLAIAEEAKKSLELDTVLFMPAGQPWMKTGNRITPVHHRVEMVRRAIAGIPYCRLSTIEVDRKGKTYTVDTLEEMKTSLDEGDELYFILGVGSLGELPCWREPERIIELCKLIVAPRPGCPEPDLEALGAKIKGLKRRVILLNGPRLDISATVIRERLARGLSIAHLVPEAVEKYIIENGLYSN